MEIKLPEGFDNRDDAIQSLIKKEIDAAESELSNIKEEFERFLIENKGYSKDEIERDREFSFEIENERCRSRADFIIKIDGKIVMLIKCSVGALVSRERQAIACARVIHSYQIPYSIVTDGNDAEVLDTVTGKVLSEGLENIPSRDKMNTLMEHMEFRELPKDRLEKEQRILLAFDAIKCTITYGE